MTYGVFIRPEAEADLAEAFEWYEDKRANLGLDFLLQVQAGLKFLERTPDIHPPEYRECRKHLIRRFPYKIIYLFDNDRVVVLAVLHGRRSPSVMKYRLRAI